MIDTSSWKREVARREKPKHDRGPARRPIHPTHRRGALARVADENRRLLLVDMSAYAGLVADGVIPSPLPHGPVVTDDDDKTCAVRALDLGWVLSTDPEIRQGRSLGGCSRHLQGGPDDALMPPRRWRSAGGSAEFQDIAQHVAKCAVSLASALSERAA